MGSEYVKRYRLEVEIQDNGIIRDPFGWIVGRCDKEWFNAVVRHEPPEREQPERTCQMVAIAPTISEGIMQCSECGVYLNEPADVNYCPMCGAKVIGGDTE